MKKYVIILISLVALASCTCAIYYQNHTTGSTQKVENPTSISADSASVNLNIPEK